MSILRKFSQRLAETSKSAASIGTLRFFDFHERALNYCGVTTTLMTDVVEGTVNPV